jgi:hypothetical protein
MADPTTDCEALRAEINALNKTFEAMWVEVSAGKPAPPEFRQIRRQLNDLRAKAAADCPPAHEETSLPPRITHDWRAG